MLKYQDIGANVKFSLTEIPAFTSGLWSLTGVSSEHCISGPAQREEDLPGTYQTLASMFFTCMMETNESLKTWGDVSHINQKGFQRWGFGSDTERNSG